jgi:hypothetical protein
MLTHHAKLALSDAAKHLKVTLLQAEILGVLQD